ncbi:hypothetical protein QVE09_11305 [Paenibacillus sp. ClWae2A]|uniref:hypothetical protein n=1 Tax=Paenibacillus sp. ClWae2A TaxID=3057177 RepID=UPI0028F66169|nr:hypothetical protein [Paenibacillus sp. ClWae2A]MDT9719493.1 hypothetical protein [Paenibacillus sp. ClWae2A]
MTATVVQGFRRYEFTSTVTNFLSTLAREMNTFPYEDVNWKVTYFPNDPYSQPRAHNAQTRTYSSPQGSLTFENLRNSNLFFSLCLNISVSYSSSSNAWTTYGYQLRCGLTKSTVDLSPYPDISLELGEEANIPFHTSNGNTTLNITYKWTVFPLKEAIFIFGEAQNNIGYAYPFRLYLGRLLPYEKEDPTVENDFIGIFSHAPVASDSNWANNSLYNVGRGIIKASRNNKKYELYNFCTSAQATSPGLGNRYFISPWYVFQPAEGVRGEFQQMRTIVFKDAKQFPDGTMIDLDGKRYHVFHVNDQQQPTSIKSWIDFDGKGRAIQPYFFDSNTLLGDGQRAILFELPTEVSK